VDHLLKDLPGQLLEVLMMRVAAGLSAEETGQVLGMSAEYAHAEFWAAVLAGGVLASVAVGWHAVVLLTGLRRALPSRFGVTVRYYVAAAALLPVGITLGMTTWTRACTRAWLSHTSRSICSAGWGLTGLCCVERRVCSGRLIQ
jgi:hypothetical protein